MEAINKTTLKVNNFSGNFWSSVLEQFTFRNLQFLYTFTGYENKCVFRTLDPIKHS